MIRLRVSFWGVVVMGFVRRISVDLLLGFRSLDERLS